MDVRVGQTVRIKSMKDLIRLKKMKKYYHHHHNYNYIYDGLLVPLRLLENFDSNPIAVLTSYGSSLGRFKTNRDNRAIHWTIHKDWIEEIIDD